ncbi:MAG: OmpA family protein [Candidatus Kapaibacterium sp.]
MRKLLLLLLFFVVSLSFIPNEAKAQSEPNRLAFGVNYGLIKYWGEFTDNQFWFGGDLFLRYNIFSQLSLQATFGLANMRYKTGEEAQSKYPEYFELYDDFGVDINDKNSVRINTYEMYISYNLFSHEPFVPYIFAGAGLMNYEPKSGDTGYDGALPNNIDGAYEKTQLVIPVGIGFESYLTDNLVLNGRGTFRLTGTDYLDDYASPDSDDDVFVTFGLGLSYYILGDADYDNDGLTNGEEKKLGTDPRDPDTDGDGLEDGAEVNVHHSDPLKQDTDGDNLNDYDEVMQYNTSPVKADTDSDGLNDGEEIARKTDPLNADTDNDRLLDGDEVKKHETDPLDDDTDGDTLIDGDEVLKYSTNPKAMDSDNDGLNDGDEVNIHKTNPASADSDDDSLKDGAEIKTHKTDPNNPDTDGDGLNDGAEINEHGTDPKNTDTDGDQLADGDEIRKHKTNPLNEDSDRDGLNDSEEVTSHETDPNNPDSDGDGLKDGDEVLKHKTDPLATDTDDDRVPDGDEVNKYKTDPLVADTDNDQLSDGAEVFDTKTDPNNPDTDGDTILDGEDDCPHVAGEPSEEQGENGCPKAPEIGTKVDFPDILFIVDSDKFNYDMPQTSRNLAKLLEYINQCEGLQVMIEGHASAEGSDEYNQKLSERRAKKVREWLIEQGVSSDKIAGFIGYGESRPKVPEPEGKELNDISKEELENIRKENRRITIEVTKTCDQNRR